MADMLRELRTIMVPPQQPIAAEGDWDQVFEELDTRLPKDYMMFVQQYGLGLTGGFIHVLSPFAAKHGLHLMEYGGSIMEFFRKQASREHNINPYPIFPDKGGLLYWGVSINGDDFFWRTLGPPDKWHVVVHDRGSLRFLTFRNETMVSFITKLLQGKLRKFRLPGDIAEQPCQFKPYVPKRRK